MKTPTPVFTLEEIVYLKVNPDLKGMIVGYLVRPTGITYLVTWNEWAEEKEHYAGELSIEKEYRTGEGES